MTNGLTLNIHINPETPERLALMVQRASTPPATPMKLFSQDMRRSTLKRFQQEGPGWPKSRRAMRQGGKTLRHTGRLFNSIQFRPGPDSLQIGTSDKRARLLHFGGTIRPKRAKALAIPWDDSVKRSPRDYKNTFIAKGIIFQKTGKGEKDIKPLFILRKSVKIPARPFLMFTPDDRGKLKARLTKHYMGA